MPGKCSQNTFSSAGEFENSLQGELQVRGAGEVPCQPGGHHAATCRGVLEVKTTRIPQKELFFTALSVNQKICPKKLHETKRQSKLD